MQPRKERIPADNEAIKRVKELAAKIVVEQDLKKFQELVREANQALEEPPSNPTEPAP